MALGQALAVHKYFSVDSILKHQLDELPLQQDTEPSSLLLFHDNVRGPEYYH